jgi:DUF2075 family protein/SOS-response transcriptional repressor LexA
MIVYQANKKGFRDDVLSNRIEEKILTAFRKNHGHGVAKSELISWKNSLAFMDRIVEPDEVPNDAGIAIEMGLPQSGKRIDFVLTGLNQNKKKIAIIVELKQWTSVQRTTKDGVVRTFLGGAEREVNHPSYQAWSYAMMLEDFNEAVQEVPINLRPCAYLHNCEDGSVIQHEFYRDHLERAPVFLKDDALRLREFIQQHVRYGDRGEILYEIVNGRIRPSKSLADKLASLLKGNREFILIDDQKLVYETAIELTRKALTGKKQTLIVEGGPGTGKSVVAINLLVELIRQKLNVQYVTRNAAPRSVYESKLTGEFKKSRISNLFRSSGSYFTCDANDFDVLLVDEAHRLNQKSGFYGNQGENQIKELICAARLSVFFVDDAQRVTMQDIGGVEAIRDLAKSLGNQVTETKLESQFRCGGSDGYLGWVDNTLGIRTTANQTLAGVNYDVKVCDSANELRTLIRAKNALTNRARMVAGYCWKWQSKKDPSKMDIVLPSENFAAQWNLDSDGSLWILREHSVEQIGCIHTCQGLELDYIGVIMGHDLVIRNGTWIDFPDRRDKGDKSIRGYYKLALSDQLAAQRKTREIIRNTYRTLMTRGLKGCFLYSVDPETNAFLKEAAQSTPLVNPPIEQADVPTLPFDVIPPKVCKPYENCVPCFPDIQIAAGAFSTHLQLEDSMWVSLPEPFTPKPGYFVAKVTGESMNRRIPNGSWCLFRAHTEGSRAGRVVLVQHRDIQNPDTGACTVKIYSSTKTATEDGWKHDMIRLRPDSTDPSFKELILQHTEDSEFRVVGELVAVVSR